MPLTSGAVVVDTPGLRLPRVWEQASGLETAFGDIAALAAQCRFADCSHNGEPGCVVAAAGADGRLSADRYAGRLALERERGHIESRRDARAQAEASQASRAMQRALRARLKEKRP